MSAIFALFYTAFYSPKPRIPNEINAFMKTHRTPNRKNPPKATPPPPRPVNEYLAEGHEIIAGLERKLGLSPGPKPLTIGQCARRMSALQVQLREKNKASE